MAGRGILGPGKSAAVLGARSGPRKKQGEQPAPILRILKEESTGVVRDQRGSSDKNAAELQQNSVVRNFVVRNENFQSSMGERAPALIVPSEEKSRGPILKIMKDESALKSRTGAIGSLQVIDEKWEHTGDKLSQFLSESNTDYQVIGILGGQAVGKSTIMNALYGLRADHPSIRAGRTPPLFPIQPDEMKTLARHRSNGIEMRVTAERLVLLDSQPVFSPSILKDISRSNGFASLPLIPGRRLRADHVLELMALQQAVFLLSVSHVVVVVSEGLQDTRMCELVRTVQELREKTFRAVPSSQAQAPTKQQGVAPIEPRAADSRDQEQLRASEDERPTSAAGNSLRSSQASQQERPPSQSETKSASNSESRRPGSASGLRPQQRPGSSSSVRSQDANSSDARKGPQNVQCPEVVFVHTKLRGSELLWSRLRGTQENLTASLPPSIVLHSGAVRYRPAAIRMRDGEELTSSATQLQDSEAVERQVKGQQGGLEESSGRTSRKSEAELEDSSGISFFPLPAKGLNSAAFESFSLSVRTLRNEILGIPRQRLLTQSMTEASWLRYTERVWRDVRESEAILQHKLTLSK